LITWNGGFFVVNDGYVNFRMPRGWMIAIPS
jgi:hypothetical protein